MMDRPLIVLPQVDMPKVPLTDGMAQFALL